MSRRHLALRSLLLLASTSPAACESEDLVVLRLPGVPAGMAGGAGVETTSGGAGAGTSSAGMSGTFAAGSAGMSAGSPGGGNAGAEQAGTGGMETGGVAGLAGISGMSGSAGAGHNDACRSNDDCPPSRVCVKNDCQAEWGECEPEPLFCEATPAPVCGCDNVTYWNDCVRRSAGVPASFPGECRAAAVACDDANDCGVEDAACSRLRSRGSIDMCPPGPGICWVLPKEHCDPGDSRRWVECVPPGAPLPPFPPPCIDTCTALMSGRPHIQARTDIVPCP
jgi:hypothetical protein